MAYRWRAVHGPLVVVFGSFLPLSAEKKNEKNVVKFWTPLDPRMFSMFYSINWTFYLFIPNTDLLTPDNAKYACQNISPGNYNRAHPLCVIQLKKDSSNKK